jgi:signal transduction histidine kinase
MRERAAELGGKLDVERGSPSGTTVRATLPIEL